MVKGACAVTNGKRHKPEAPAKGAAIPSLAPPACVACQSSHETATAPFGARVQSAASPRPLPARPAGEAVRQLGCDASLSSRPLPARLAGEAVRQLGAECRPFPDPCRLVRQVKQF